MTFNVKSDYFNRNNNCYPYHFYHSWTNKAVYTIYEKNKPYYKYTCSWNPVPIGLIWELSKWESLLYVR
jgi:hypothetical protein